MLFPNRARVGFAERQNIYVRYRKMTKRSTDAWKVIHEEISAENVLRMSELIALQETKFLIGYIGVPMVEAHRSLCVDIANKNNFKYILSNSYDYVQEIAVFLCENMGRTLSDTYRVDIKGRSITIQMQAERELGKLINYKMCHLKSDTSLEKLSECKMPTAEIPEDSNAIEESYDKVDKIIASLNLNETQYKALQYQMNGMSFTQITRESSRAVSTTFKSLQKVQKRYLSLYK